ncbi:phosphopantetheine-binding protein [Dactylosporangium sp. CA-233914]|uniref:phosphopantetheine-binding protein n=1 Tax=Dactylosporangium sp. CA-233914 TaxID=3239934 RepID=UPI003D948A13
MNSLEDFLALIEHELGVSIDADQAHRGLDEVDNWDSMYLLTVLSMLERRTGRPVSLPAMMNAHTLADIYRLAVAA